MLLGQFGRMPGLFLRSPDGAGGGGGTPAPEAGGGSTPAMPSQSQPLPTNPAPLATSDQAFQTALAEAGFGPNSPVSQQFTALQGQIEQVLSNAEEDRQRRAGLDRRFSQYDARQEQLGQQLGQILEMLGGNGQTGGQPSAPSTPAPESTPAPAAITPDTQDLQNQLAQMQAEQARARAIRTVSADMPGLDLLAWEENIPLREGQEAQVQAVREFAERLQGQLGTSAQAAAEQRQRALTEGMTPGSSPAPPAAPEDADAARYQEIWGIMNDVPRWMGLSAEERSSMEAEFDTLSPNYGHTIGDGFSVPWAGPGELGTMMRQMQQQIGMLQQQVNAGPVAPPT